MRPPGEEERVEAEGTAHTNTWRRREDTAWCATATEGRWVRPVGCRSAVLQNRDCPGAMRRV